MPLCPKTLDGFTATDQDRREFPRDPGAISLVPRKNKQREEFPRRVRDL